MPVSLFALYLQYSAESLEHAKINPTRVIIVDAEVGECNVRIFR